MSRARRAAAVRTRDADATRSALKRAATLLFARRGFAGATADRIAREAGVNKAMINYHFGGKRGLHTAIIRETFAEMLGRLEQVTASPDPPAQRLRHLIEAFAATVAGAPELPAILLREVLTGGEHLDGEVLASIMSILGAVRGIVEAGVASGDFRPVDPLLTHLSLMGSLVFFFATEEFRRKVLARTKAAPLPSAAAFVSHLQDLMTRGLVEPGARRQR